jgi:tetratricopeptide (TPR) repeat protein
MENSLTDIEWIERYLDNTLSTEERKWMEQRLAEEPELNNQYKEHRQLIEGIRYAHLHEKLLQLRALEKTMPSIAHKPKRGNQIMLYWKPMAAAATITILMTVYFITNRPVKSEELFAQYFQTYPNVFEPTVRGDIQADKRSDAFGAYDRGDYKTAAILFEQLLKDKEEPGILILLGNANLVLGNVEAAQTNFLMLIKDFDELDGQAKWFLGLSYLKQGNEAKARLILQELGDPEFTYSKKAKELLKNVK